ncbi:cupin domain-containing protein [Deinococcus yavapaiensis]|uniref:Quercetin dioxygenase-like cupin family protein n=1 Tax=Deinococcus yavapaiensis KR-236 TaxID=694435 RepID=A0A318SC47_9DEIO|nr:hypothetical protein [Deinococcus yavapaiensis]PYE56588.1 hypothetical protein DES52_101393 [Deinococcus yavapaiensis KR-236]
MNSERPESNPLPDVASHPEVKVFRRRLDPHARLPEHTHKGREVVVTVVSGDLTLTLGAQARFLTENDVATFGGDVVTSLRAGERGAEFTVTLVPVTAVPRR